MPVKESAETKANFSMKMPDWFIKLSLEEKKTLINKIETESQNFCELTDDELEGFMVSKPRRRF